MAFPGAPPTTAQVRRLVDRPVLIHSTELSCQEGLGAGHPGAEAVSHFPDGSELPASVRGLVSLCEATSHSLWCTVSLPGSCNLQPLGLCEEESRFRDAQFRLWVCLVLGSGSEPWGLTGLCLWPLMGLFLPAGASFLDSCW